MQFLIWNEMNSDANIDAHLQYLLDQKSIVKKTWLVSLRFFYQYLVDHGWHTSYQCCVLSTWTKVP